MSLKSSVKKNHSPVVRLAIFVLVLLVIILFLSKISRMGKTLFSPWMDQKNITTKQYPWDERFSINVILQGRNIFLLSYSKQNKSAVLITLPKNTYVDVAYGMGQWQLGSVFNLGETGQTNGMNLVEKTISMLFGLPVDGFIELKGDLFDKDSSEVVDALKKGPLNIFSIISNLKSDLTLWELIRLKFALSDVRLDKIKILDLRKLGILSQVELPDKTHVFSIDNAALDGVLDSLIDPAMREEALSVAVLNGTLEPLVAQKGARILSNNGVNVIITSNTEKKFKRSFVYGKESKTLTRLVQIFNSPCSKKEECDKIEPELNGEPGPLRADINVILGEDFAQIY